MDIVAAFDRIKQNPLIGGTQRKMMLRLAGIAGIFTGSKVDLSKNFIFGISTSSDFLSLHQLERNGYIRLINKPLDSEEGIDICFTKKGERVAQLLLQVSNVLSRSAFTEALRERFGRYPFN